MYAFGKVMRRLITEYDTSQAMSRAAADDGVTIRAVIERLAATL